jgi:hypothetical protein
MNNERLGEIEREGEGDVTQAEIKREKSTLRILRFDSEPVRTYSVGF